MDDNDRLRVNNFLQVEGLTDVYAVGDCCNADEIRMAYNAGLQAKLVAQNIQLAAAGKNYKSYKSGSPTMFVSVGRHGGVAEIGGNLMGSFMVKKLKSSELFVNKYWKEMRQAPPSRQKSQATRNRQTTRTRAPTTTAAGKKKDETKPPASGKPGATSQPKKEPAAKKGAPTKTMKTGNQTQQSQTNQHERKSGGTKQAAQQKSKKK